MSSKIRCLLVRWNCKPSTTAIWPHLWPQATHRWRTKILGLKMDRVFSCFLSGWWFQIVFIFTPTWGNLPIWLIFSNGLKPPTSCWFVEIKSLGVVLLLFDDFLGAWDQFPLFFWGWLLVDVFWKSLFDYFLSDWDMTVSILKHSEYIDILTLFVYICYTYKHLFCLGCFWLGWS